MGIVFSNDDWSVKTTDEIENELWRTSHQRKNRPSLDESAKDDETAVNEAKREQIRQNALQGKAFERQGKKIVESMGDKDLTEQVTIKTKKTGTKTRPDLLSKGPDGKVKITEFKSSSTAPLTKNQATAFPEIETEGGVVVGKGKPPFVGGTEIPPTKVNVIRPEGVD